VNVNATVSAAVAKVQFFLDGGLVATDTNAPFAWSWNTVQTLDGPHTLTAQAYSALPEILLGVSAPVAVTVSNGAGSTGGPDNYEPNDSSTLATAMNLGSSLQSYISSPTDVDWFKVNVTNAGTLSISLSVPAGKDYDLELYGPSATWLAGSYNKAGIAESIQQNVTVLGTYYFRVYGYPVGAGDYSSAPYTISAALTTQTTTNSVGFNTTGAMNKARYLHTATLLPNGKVLVADGFDGTNLLSSAELYDPASGTWAPTGSMTTARYNHIATLLSNGKVLVVGFGGTTELYDPATGRWTATGVLDTDPQ
jgi:hypothetical protein